MRQQLKEQRRREQLAALLGMEQPTETVNPARWDKENASREAESVLAFIDRPEAFKEKSCRQCGSRFLVNRGNVACCSDRCRAKGLSDLGIEWDWNKPPNERWYYRYQGDPITHEPLVIGEGAINTLVDAGLYIVPEQVVPSSNTDPVTEVS